MTPLFPSSEPPRLLDDLRVEPAEAKSILRAQKDERYGFGFALNPYRGCAHGCRYCYVREYPNALHRPEDWGAWVATKTNASELLWTQRHRLHQQRVFLASATDPYQPQERHDRLTRQCLEVLLLCPTTEVILHTRSPLVLQDLDLLRAFGNRLSVGISMPTDDDTVRQAVEPHAPAIPSRWAAMERLASAGIEVGISVAPLLAVHDPRAFARRAKMAGASHAWVGALRLLKQDPFYAVLAEHGWLRVLQPGYLEGIRQKFRELFPLRGPAREPLPVPVRGGAPPAWQPGLFDPGACP